MSNSSNNPNDGRVAKFVISSAGTYSFGPGSSKGYVAHIYHESGAFAAREHGVDVAKNAHLSTDGTYSAAKVKTPAVSGITFHGQFDEIIVTGTTPYLVCYLEG